MCRRLEVLDEEVRDGKLDPRRANTRIYALSTAIGGYQTLANIMSGDVAAEIAELRESLLGLGDGRQTLSERPAELEPRRSEDA
jgi:hypothetical protein